MNKDLHLYYTGVFQTFASKNQRPGLSVRGTSVENGLKCSSTKLIPNGRYSVIVNAINVWKRL